MQDTLVWLAVGVSAFWLACRFLRSRRSPCGGCSGCGGSVGKDESCGPR